MRIPIFNSIFEKNMKRKIKTNKININNLNNLNLKKINEKKFPLIKILKLLPKKNSLLKQF